MIEIYTDSSSWHFKRFVNIIIGDIIEDFIDIGGNLDYEEIYATVFPWHMGNEKDKCIEILNTLSYYWKDDMIHKLSPLYERVLYEIIKFLIDSTDDEFDLTYTVKMYKKQYKKIYNNLNEEEKSLINEIKSPHIFIDLCFEDFDFREDSVDNILKLLQNDINNNTDLVGDFLHMNIEEIDKYAPLMPPDKKEEYEKLKNIFFQNHNILPYEENIVAKEIYNAIKMLENNPGKLRNISETELSDDIRNIVQASLRKENIIVEREMPSGFAKKSIGELDFYIYTYINNTYNVLSIGENKEWGKFKEQLKQLLGYMKCDTKFGFTILFNKTINLDTLIKSRNKILKEFFVEKDDKKYFEVIGDITKLKEMKNVVVTLHKNPEDNTYFEIYHFIVNAKLDEREETAKQARK
ncbi:hypothetical protein FDF50_12020 [Clostridium botulinum]|uniref:Uncharacterized protein n=1 Tax=Clostridium botulinum TaxID=1491 RepID=A0A6G4HPG4_CLOBO|nr:hypothetical protein [Clostridium botulinum]MBD5587423.1 hypothetical protein [Clostridium botulinum]MBO0571619.1 hypothetical protein [Clostridium botulinum]NFJ60619.1 hypothetical protein [Clostridium botulinum]NFJ67202.1 hypothetical protein [Clostridium botulinum]NFQ62740.1 hypothetical protein [Clostridium botulinum]